MTLFAFQIVCTSSFKWVLWRGEFSSKTLKKIQEFWAENCWAKGKIWHSMFRQILTLTNLDFFQQFFLLKTLVFYPQLFCGRRVTPSFGRRDVCGMYQWDKKLVPGYMSKKVIFFLPRTWQHFLPAETAASHWFRGWQRLAEAECEVSGDSRRRIATQRPGAWTGRPRGLQRPA